MVLVTQATQLVQVVTAVLQDRQLAHLRTQVQAVLQTPAVVVRVDCSSVTVVTVDLVLLLFPYQLQNLVQSQVLTQQAQMVPILGLSGLLRELIQHDTFCKSKQRNCRASYCC